jgi:transmembrane sensor
MSREIFHDLLEKYQKGLCTDAEKRIVSQWYGLLDANDQVPEPEELADLEQKLWNKISNQISESDVAVTTDKHTAHWSFKELLAIAATVCISISLIAFFSHRTKDHNSAFLADKTQVLKTILNNGVTPRLVILEDGSQVTLQPNASLTFPSHFKQAVREVSLKGDGFFLISKNPERPFLVYNKHITTRVLGTSFNIRLNPKTKEMEVTVRTGKVRVEQNAAADELAIPALFKPAKEVTLIPNEKASYSDSEQGFKTTLADNPVPVLKKDGQPQPLPFRFNDALVKDVVARLTETYGIKIIVQSEDLNNNTFTGDLSAQNLYSKLDFLCQSIGARYQVAGTQIIIKKQIVSN